MDQRVASSTQMGKDMFGKMKHVFCFPSPQVITCFNVQRTLIDLIHFPTCVSNIVYYMCILFLLCFIICLRFNKKIDEFVWFFEDSYIFLLFVDSIRILKSLKRNPFVGLTKKNREITERRNISFKISQTAD